jgi:Na+-translocating ferredoxin:NAD+ oxidoreductase RnfC subunit
MEKAQILKAIKDAGVIGAGGAGFPTHIKLDCKADTVICNGAECEPLLRSDRLLMEHHAGRVVAGLKAAMEAAGAKRGVIAVKKKYERAAEALKRELQGDNMELLLIKSFYPAGDEQQLVYEATGRVVPVGGLPLDVETVVQNAATLLQTADALEGKPVIERYVTVNGEVKRPAVFNVPIGTPVKRLIDAAGGPDGMADYAAVVGGPVMGRITDDMGEPVSKTTGGVLVFPKDHPLIRKRSGSIEQDLRLAMSVCCQCNFCTQMCPRNALGLKVEPHRVMRAMALGAKDIGDANGVFSCCDCGICTYYACNFSLAPSRIMQKLKQELIKAGVKPYTDIPYPVSESFENIKVPTGRLEARLGIDKYDRELPFMEEPLKPGRVVLPLKMHIGAPAKPVVKSGERVEKGQLVAGAAEGVSANVHASIAGTARVADSYVEIEGNL